MKKTNISALLLAALLLMQLLCAPVSAVTAEPAADAQADAQTASDNSAGDAAAEADSVPEDQLLSSREQFSVAAKAALLIDLNTNRVVYEQDADERVYPASLTKIMTCLIALENGNLSDVVTVSESALADLEPFPDAGDSGGNPAWRIFAGASRCSAGRCLRRSPLPRSKTAALGPQYPSLPV